MLDTPELANWQQKILSQLDSRLARYFVVEDPDCLLAEQSLQTALSEKGFKLHFFEDSIELRYYLSVQFVSDSNCCVISVDSNKHDSSALPFDVLINSQRLSVSLSDCFPNIAYNVLKSLQVGELSALDTAIDIYTPGQMNESASWDFVLRHVFKVAPEVIQSLSDLLSNLLSLHRRDVELPNSLARRLIALLSNRQQFDGLPLNVMVSSKQGFFDFLQEHWPDYVADIVESKSKETKEPSTTYLVFHKRDTKDVLPFGHDDVRVYIEDLFLEGCLTPIEVEASEKLVSHWCLVGVLQDSDKQLKKRTLGLLALCEEDLPEVSDRYQLWLQYAYRWAELSACYHMNEHQLNDVKVIADGYSSLQKKVDDRFSTWMLEKYGSLHNHPPMPPVMLHHVPRAMAREIEQDRSAKSALILIDGLAIDQWVTLKSHLELGVDIEESAVFAWVPTVTSVSRQALFSAKAPYQFPSSIATTSTEPKAWERFWLDHGLNKNEVFYKKSLGTDDVNALIDELSDRRLRAVGLVINTVDDMMHGMQLGAAGMHNQVKLWAESGYLLQLVNGLMESGFSVHITSDHGNVESIGSGKITEAGIARSRGERARVYATETLRSSVEFDDSEVLNWSQAGLPKDYWPAVMKGRKAFVAKNDKIVGHGGVAIEEVIVPYITIKRDSDEK